MSKLEYKLSLLIPGWNAAHYTENCVNSLLENDYTNFEIILITGGSDDSYNISLKLKKKYPIKIKVFKQEIPHKNAALNIGLKGVTGDIIVLTDIDCVYQKNWLSSINKIFQNQHYNVITGLYLPFPDGKNSLAEFNRIHIGSNLLTYDDEDIIIGNKLCGANAAFRRDIFRRKIKKFDESIPTGDDKILGLTFNIKGEELYFFKDIYVYTECYSNSIIKFIKRRIRWARDLFINKLSKKQIFLLVISFGISLFKLFSPIFALIFWYLFFKSFLSVLLILLSFWIIFYVLYIIKFYLKLKKMSIDVNSILNTNFNYKKAVRIIPLLFFAYAIITLVSFIKPKRGKWNR